jgi:hypothetical protein
MFYRRMRGIDTWHWSKKCKQYPRAGYEEVREKPAGAVFCDDCAALNPTGAPESEPTESAPPPAE